MFRLRAQLSLRHRNSQTFDSGWRHAILLPENSQAAQAAGQITPNRSALTNQENDHVSNGQKSYGIAATWANSPKASPALLSSLNRKARRALAAGGNYGDRHWRHDCRRRLDHAPRSHYLRERQRQCQRRCGGGGGLWLRYHSLQRTRCRRSHD